MQQRVVLYGILVSFLITNRTIDAIQARSDKEQPQTVGSGTAVQSVVPVQAQLGSSSSSVSSSSGSNSAFHPLGPNVLCSFLPRDFLECKDPIDHRDNATAKMEKGYGCLRFGGSSYEDVEHTKVQCTVYSDIDCYGNRTFFREGVPCVRYTDHYFVTTLIYSMLLGFLGMDRFCLGQTGTAVGKLLTMGGVGVWWIIDVILLITNNLLPEDGSNWNPYV
ncbi:TM2 domain-containing protein CG11103-like [Drosophila guanche]|uniref:Blast:TM2 domain-containing protein CG11103 n=1 Tax=Drosophila guanche TaxID=7266 RepID=A0A3B0JWK1_DROGU|nr:TM2 domain-containing protein CG11103-like [Drosophila guanche]SPP78099.1 blast:TM2 domain-containing protein CG11103 [Drosophila guanche]